MYITNSNKHLQVSKEIVVLMDYLARLDYPDVKVKQARKVAMVYRVPQVFLESPDLGSEE